MSVLKQYNHLTEQWEYVVVGKRGLKGGQGDVGPANSLDIGAVTTLPTGESASAEITGEAPTQTLNLNIPRGDAGPQGPLWSAEIRSANSSDNLYNYIGKAADSSLEADAVWTITRITLTDPVGVKTTATNVAWTDRETAVYS